jgi:hypothetical protein
VLRDRAADDADIAFDAPVFFDEHVAAEGHHAVLDSPAHDDRPTHPEHVLRIVALDNQRRRIILGHANGRHSRVNRDPGAKNRAKKRTQARNGAQGGKCRRRGRLKNERIHVCYRVSIALLIASAAHGKVWPELLRMKRAESFRVGEFFV